MHEARQGDSAVAAARAGTSERPDLVVERAQPPIERADVFVDRLEVTADRDELAVDRLEVAGRLPGRVLLVGSSGGHLAQLLALAPLWDQDRRTYVTFGTPDAVSQLHGERVTWAYHPTTRNVPNLLRNSVLAVRELRRRRPDVVVSTGAAVGFPFFVCARALGIPTVFVEVYDRIDSPTLTGRLCRPLATLFCVQWPEQARFYHGSELVGSLM